MSRETWKIYYRLLRIARREASKASLDLAIYGSAFISVSETGECHHIPLEKVRIN